MIYMKKKLIIALVAISMSLGAIPASALTFSPAIREYNKLPGEVVTETLRLYNDSNRDATYYPIFMDYTAPKDESGTPSFVPQGSVATSGSLALWFGKIEPISIKAKGRQEIIMTINIPKTAEPGGHYGAILFSDQPTTNDSIGVGSQTGPIFLVNILGDVKEDMTILDFKAQKNSYTTLPVSFQARFQNKGSVHETPMGTINLRGWWPRNLSIPVNERGMSHVLPNSIRKMDYFWGDQNSSPQGFMANLKSEWQNIVIGRFEAQLSINYGVQRDETITKTASFWVFPWHLGLVILGIIIVLVLILRGYNQMIVAMAQKSKK